MDKKTGNSTEEYNNYKNEYANKHYEKKKVRIKKEVKALYDEAVVKSGAVSLNRWIIDACLKQVGRESK